jgi:hypothetical protein
MKKIMTVTMAALVVFASAGSLAAHHSLAQFDTATAVRVKGTVVRFERMNPHSILFVDQKVGDGKTYRWALEGPRVGQLESMGIGKDALRVGDVIEACGYVTREGVESQRTVSTEPISLSLKASTPKTMSGRLMDAELLVMPGGQIQKWSDYGQHLCLGPDYHDFHK